MVFSKTPIIILLLYVFVLVKIDYHANMICVFVSSYGIDLITIVELGSFFTEVRFTWYIA